MAGTLVKVVSVVQVEIDGENVGIIPGSFAYYDGKPKRDAKSLDDGTVCYSENKEEAIGKMKFELPSTEENLNRISTYENRRGSTIKAYGDGDFVKVMSNGVTTNDSERTIGTNGKIPVEYIGTPLD